VVKRDESQPATMKFGLCDVKKEFGDVWRVILRRHGDASRERLGRAGGTRTRANRFGRDPFLKETSSHRLVDKSRRLAIDPMAAHPWPPI